MMSNQRVVLIVASVNNFFSLIVINDGVFYAYKHPAIEVSARGVYRLLY